MTSDRFAIAGIEFFAMVPSFGNTIMAIERKYQSRYLQKSRRIRTVLNEDQRFSETEFDLLHTPALQRLYDLHQLGLTDRIFIDASHSRLHHVVGVVEMAEKMMDAIIGNLEREGEKKLPYGTTGETVHTAEEVAEIASRKKPAVRLMAMLHDLTHAPYGHTLEDEIHLVSQKHDEPERQADAFLRLALQYFGWIERNEAERAWGTDDGVPPKNPDDFEGALHHYLDAPSLRTPRIDDDFIDYIAKRWANLLAAPPRENSFRKVSAAMLEAFVRDLAFAMRGLLFLDIAHKDKRKAKGRHVPADEYPVERLFKGMLSHAGRPLKKEEEFEPRRDVFLLDVIGNTICADLLDYARRDSALAGLRLDYDPNRIIANMTVISWHTKPFIVQDTIQQYPFSHRCLRTAISVFSHKLRIDVPGELLNLLQVRYFVYERMLFHPTKCVAGALLGAAVQFIGWKTLPFHLRFVGDAVFLHTIEEAARVVRDLLSRWPDSKQHFTADLAQKLDKQFAAAPDTASLQTARTILADRLCSVESLRKYFETLASYPTRREAAQACLEALHDEAPEHSLDTGLIQKLSSALRENQAATKLVSMTMPTIGSIREDMRTALRLLGRLSARRYHKIVFRMLPDVKVDGLPDLTVEEIADKFLNARIRNIAEREIEARLQPSLPPGSVVIHCPPAEGPTKIANILLTDGLVSESGCHENAARLNDIAKLNGELFTEHQKSVQALEKMYKSTWRLAVSVAPPHETRWAEIEKITGEVLFELLSEGDVLKGQVPNDKFLQREIDGLVARNKADAQSVSPGVEVVQSQTTVPQSVVERRVLELIRVCGHYDDLLIGDQLDDAAFTRRIMGKKRFETERALTEFLDEYIKESELADQEKKAFRRLKTTTVAFNDRAQAYLQHEVERLVPKGGLEFNLASLDGFRRIVEEAAGLDAKGKQD